METVVRYQVEFTPHETNVLRQDAEWRQVLSISSSVHNGRSSTAIGKATLTKTQLSRACDALGINLREFMARTMARSRSRP